MKVLFVCYGGGHVEMCLPVMRALRERVPGCEARVMALTTGYEVARRAGEEPLGYRDFCDGPLAVPSANLALAFGEDLVAGHRHPSVAPEESVAYLGLNFLEWVRAEGEAWAHERWRETGRFGFLPVIFFRQVLERLQPDVVVSTNAPRSEQAVIEAAAALGIPSLSMVDLFALPGDPYLERKVHADCITVLTQATRDNLVAAGVDAPRIVVTGNPAFDALRTPEARAEGQAFRTARGWGSRHVILWAGHKEPDDDAGLWSGIRLGQAVQRKLAQWVLAHDDLCLAVRYHPNEWHDFLPLSEHPRLYWSRPDRESLLPVLLAADQVVVQATTVGAQAQAAGKRVVNLGFSPLVQRNGMDYAALGIAQRADNLDDLVPVLEQGLREGGARRRNGETVSAAAPAVAQLIAALALARSPTPLIEIPS